MRMPPPMKNIVTSEHEEVLWNSKHLSTDSSIGLIQAVIFYLIKCFGLWQGKDLRLLKTEHVMFGEDDMGKFVAIDIKAAVGSGKVVKRYDDPANPRSTYKILKTYKGYLANEGPFLVRPISSIKDYICYSPWPLGVNIIEQTVLNLLQESGIGPGFGNVSVCLMAINTLKSFGAGSHCISTWMLRLYPRYKKTFWADAFKECSTMNCEDRSQEACLVMSHLLDPPYPASTKMVEMRKKQEMMKSKLEAMSARKSSVFNSWLSNINSNASEGDDSADSPVLAEKRTNSTISQKSAPKFVKEKVRAVCKADSRKSEKLDSSLSSSIRSSLSTSTSVPPAEVTVKAEVMFSEDYDDTISDGSNVKIMTVLSIPESAYSAQVDEGECAAHGRDVVDGVFLTKQVDKVDCVSHCTDTTSDNSSSLASTDETKTDDSKLGADNQGTKRKSEYLEDFDESMVSGVKQKKICRENERTGSGCDKGSRNSHVHGDIAKGNGIEAESDGSLASCSSVDIKCEQDSECEDITHLVHEGPALKTEDIEHDDLTHDDHREHPENGNAENQSQDSISRPPSQHATGYENVSSAEQTDIHEVTRKDTVSIDLKQLETTTKPEGSQFAHILKADITFRFEQPSSSSSQTSLLSPLSLNPSDQIKDSIEILRKLFQPEGKSNKSGTALGKHGNDFSCNVTPDNSLVHRIQSKGSVDNEVKSGVSSALPEFHNVSILVKCNKSKDVSLSESSTSVISHPVHCDSALIRPSEAVKNINAEKNHDLLSQPALNIVKFLDAANKQLQNILKTSDNIGDNDISEGSPVTAVCTQSSQLKNDFTNDPLKIQKLDREKDTTDLESEMTSSDCNHVPESSSASVSPEKPSQKSVCGRDMSYALLRSVLESPGSPAEARSLTSPCKDSRNGSVVQARSRGKKFLPALARLKSSCRLHNHQQFRTVRGFYDCAANSSKKICRRKYGNVFQKSSNLKIPNRNGRIGLCHKLVQIRKFKHCGYCRGCFCDSSHTHSPSLSLLQQVPRDTNTGIYYYHSNHSANAAYQTLQVLQENDRVQTFVIPDLPLDVPHSRKQEDCVGLPTSEICLGDYFSKGTVLPTKDMKLLTRQGPNGLEVVFKFGYISQKDNVHASNGDSSSKNVHVPSEQITECEESFEDVDTLF